ncbi:MAG TPA: hypothetical protein VLC12_05995, partial [Terriglobales bacterium]|nr:hypothetical protein [Terriglobales bacterium]
TLAYQIGDEGRKTAVPSFSNVTGGRGCGPPPGECKEESVFLFLNIPIAPAEAITEFREFTKKLEAERPQSPEERQRVEERIRDLESHPDELAETVKQYRPGHFEVECRIMDGNRPWAVGHVELEILFKGRAFDALLGKPQQGR